MSYNTRLLRMKKCKSLTDIGDEDFEPSRKTSGGHKLKKKMYTGRRSLGIAASKLRHKKGKTPRDRDYDYGENEDVDEGYNSVNCTYKCIQPLEMTTETAKLDTQKCEEKDEQVVIVSDRKTLNYQLSKLLKENERAKDQVVMCHTNQWCRIYGDTMRFTVVGKDQKQYKLANILWLVLRIWFAEGNFNDETEWQQHDAKTCKKRMEKEKILRKIELYTFFENRGQSPRPRGVMEAASPLAEKRLSISKEYIKTLLRAQKEVEELLEEFDEFTELFQHLNACWESVEARILSRLELEEPRANKAELKQQAKKEKELIEKKVTLMRGWSNTLKDLVDKVMVMKRIVSESDNNVVWLEFNEENTVRNLNDVKHVFEHYVRRSINLKGMKKVIERVENSLRVTLLKASLFLQRPVQSYADAATVANKRSLKLCETMRSRYVDMMTTKLGADAHSLMNLPFLGPIFFFLLGIPMQLVIQWLHFRMRDSNEADVSMDDLSYEALIEDSRDCVQEAVRIKQNYVNILQSMCPICALPEFLFPIDFNQGVLGVFNKYIHYLRCWSNCETVMVKDPTKMFLRLEKEWPIALEASRFIASAPDVLFGFLCDFTSTSLEKMVDEYTEDQLEDIKSKLCLEGDDMNLLLIDPSDVKFLSRNFFSPVYQMIRFVHDTESRIFSLLKTAIADFSDCVGYEMRDGEPIKSLVDSLKSDHCLIRLKIPLEKGASEVSLPVALFVDVQTANHADVDSCLLWIYERRKLETCQMEEGQQLPSNCHVIVVPDLSGEISREWSARKESVQIDEEKRIHFGYIRSDQILVLGNYKLEERAGNLVKVISPSTTSNEIVFSRLKYLVEENLFSHVSRYQLKLDLLRTKVAETGGMHRELKMSFLQQHFLINFQVYRDVMRIVSDGYMNDFGPRMVEEFIKLLFNYKVFVETRSYRPSTTLPAWAMPALIFMQACSEPKWTNEKVMTLAQYSTLIGIVEDCKAKLVIPEHDRHLLSPHEERPKERYKFRTSSSSSKMTMTMEPPLSRAERLQLAVEKTEEKADLKRGEYARLGKVVDRFDGKSQLGISSNRKGLTERKAPFEWIRMEEIGYGSFGVVYRAHVLKLGRVVAAKTMKVDSSSKVDQISNEIDILMRLNHENLVKYYGVEVTKTEVIIFMEYCSEGTLERVCDGGMDLKIARRYTNHLLKAVDYIHKSHVVHRDIKPENIFLDKRDALKLGDYGCSKFLSGTATVVGEFMEFVGTPHYMAPELFSQGGSTQEGKYKGYGRSVDIWSVGCVVIHMLTGKPIWPKEMNHFQIAWELCEKKSKPEYPQIAAERKDLTNFLDATLAHDPANRAQAAALLDFTFVNVSLVDDNSPLPTV